MYFATLLISSSAQQFARDFTDVEAKFIQQYEECGHSHFNPERMAKPHLTAMLQKSLLIFRDHTDKRMKAAVAQRKPLVSSAG